MGSLDIVYHLDYNSNMHTDHLALLRLMQLADSALPVGAAAHSFGLETFVAEEYLEVAQLGPFLRDYLEEAGVVEGAFCRLGYHLASHTDRALFTAEWLALNEQLSAIKTARESRAASAALGRRFLQLLLSLEDAPLIQIAMQSAKSTGSSGRDTHYSIAFGLAGGIVQVDETAVILAYLQQSLIGLVSACQRLLPLGQSQASQLIWQLKPTLLTVADRSKEVAANSDEMSLCTPLVEVGSMRHPYLATRLFIS
jgi:urease accessory protein